MNFTKQFALRKPESQRQTAGNNAGAEWRRRNDYFRTRRTGCYPRQAGANPRDPRRPLGQCAKPAQQYQNRGYFGVLTSPLFDGRRRCGRPDYNFGLNFTF
jgi:hypothetical protein